MFRIAVNSIMVLLSCVLGVFFLEIALRTVVPTSNTYRIWPPFIELTAYFDGIRHPGVQGIQNFRINSRGLRADELSSENDYLVLAVGGSTTESIVIDQSKTWPYLLQNLLDNSGKVNKTWVGNAGRSGHSSREHIFQVRHLLDEYSELDLLVILVGVNDFGRRLKADVNYDPHMLERDDIEDVMIPRAFSQYPLKFRDGIPYYKRLELYGRARTIRDFVKSRFIETEQVQDSRGYSIDGWRLRRKNARQILETLPNLAEALVEYRRNLSQIIDNAEDKGVKLLLLSQPSMWRHDLSKDEMGLLWWGGIGDFMKSDEGRDYYSVMALAKGMSLYNQTLLEVCGERQISCLDLAALLPKDTTVFYDDAHFNINGSRLVARYVADYIVGNMLE